MRDFIGRLTKKLTILLLVVSVESDFFASDLVDSDLFDSELFDSEFPKNPMRLKMCQFHFPIMIPFI